MIVFYSECRPEYGTYTFPYAVYCLAGGVQEFPDVYGRGFLPYSGDPSLRREIFYLARSVRVDLERFSDTSENRRVDRKAADLELTLEATPKAECAVGDPEFQRFCTGFADERFSGGAMSEERLAYILGRDTLTHILTFRSHGERVAHVFTAIGGPLLHYWFAFYDTRYLVSHSLGKWVMWRTLHWAREQGLRHVYLGTCYTEKALYKVRDHRGIEWFNGVGWSRDLEALKQITARDAETGDRDLLKPPWDGLSHSVFDAVLGTVAG